MISKTKIKKNAGRKTSSELIETIRDASKHKGWIPVAKLISGTRKNIQSINLTKIENESRVGDTIIVPGKVLGAGTISKKVRICALSFSESAKGKLKGVKAEVVPLIEEIKKNPKAEGIKIIR